jgi:methyl-accepting chemotaxis protein
MQWHGIRIVDRSRKKRKKRMGSDKSESSLRARGYIEEGYSDTVGSVASSVSEKVSTLSTMARSVATSIHKVAQKAIRSDRMADQADSSSGTKAKVEAVKKLSKEIGQSAEDALEDIRDLKEDILAIEKGMEKLVRAAKDDVVGWDELLSRKYK